MRDDQFEKAMDTWAESELESAPDLRPTAEMVRLVQARQEPRRALPISSRWAVAGAGAAGILLIVALFALLLRSGVIPGYPPIPEPTLIAQREGQGVVETTTVRGEGKGEGAKGHVPVPAALRKVVFEIQRHDSPAVQAVDLLNPPKELLILTPADNYRLVLELVEETHVYVYQYTSSGSLVRLFPNPAYSAVPNPLLPGQLTVLPAEPNWLYLDGVPGEEWLCVVTSPQPLGELDDLYAQYTRESDAADKRELLLDWFNWLATIVEAPPARVDALAFVFRNN